MKSLCFTLERVLCRVAEQNECGLNQLRLLALRVTSGVEVALGCYYCSVVVLFMAELSLDFIH